MKTLKIEIPNGFEIDKEKSTFEEIVFKPIRKELPKYWKELGEIKGYYVDEYSELDYIENEYCSEFAINTFATEDQAHAAIALAQLSQLREVYRDGWKPDWTDYTRKHIIYFYKDEIGRRTERAYNEFLSFQDVETRDLFLKNFRDLIEQAKPLLS